MAKKKGMTRANKFSGAKNKKIVGSGHAMLTMRPKISSKMKKQMGFNK